MVTIFNRPLFFAEFTNAGKLFSKAKGANPLSASHSKIIFVLFLTTGFDLH